MREFLQGAALSLVINVLTVIGWYYIGMWPPAIGNALLALLIVGFYGLEDKWAFPLGYWTVQLFAIVAWFMSMGYASTLSF